MLRLVLFIFFGLSISKLSSQSATLYIYSADNTAFNIALSETDSTAKSTTGFEVINIETEIQGLSVFVNNLPAYKKRIFMRLGDTTIIVIKNNQLNYVDSVPSSKIFTRIDARSLKSKKTENTLLTSNDDLTKKPKANTEKPVRYGYEANENLGADSFILPGTKSDSAKASPCDYTLDDKDLRRLKSKLKLFPDPFDQKRMLEEDLEFTCYTAAQMLEVLNNIDSDEAKFLLLRNIWSQCSTPNELLALQAVFKDNIYRKDFSDFLNNRINE